MDDCIFVVDGEHRLTPLRERPYETEEELQRLLADCPELLGGLPSDSKGPNRWLLIAREAAVSDSLSQRWSLDHLFVDRASVPTFVEVKRSSDTRIRREVVGQMLDYAANAVAYLPVQQLIQFFERSCAERGRASEDVLAEHLDGGDPEAFWQEVKTNLQAGKVRMVFVADAIPPELRRIVEFLNEQMDPAEVIGLELRRYQGGDLQTLVPRIVGRTAEAQARKSVSTPRYRRWDKASVLEELRGRVSEEELGVAVRLFEFAELHGMRGTFGQGLKDGSYIPVLDHAGESYWPFALWTYGRAEIQFQYLAPKPPFREPALREEFRKRLNAIPAVSIPETSLERRPSIPLSALAAGDALEQFIQALDWVIDCIRTYQPPADAE